MYLKYILVRFIPSIILPPPPFLEQFQKVSFFYFYIRIQNTFTIFTVIHLFFMSTPPLTGTFPWKRPQFYPPVLRYFLSVYCSPRVFHLSTSGLYIICSNQINPLTTCLLKILKHTYNFYQTFAQQFQIL
jgi:hypothetical protein